MVQVCQYRVTILAFVTRRPDAAGALTDSRRGFGSVGP